jgi:hypothetical protein
MCEFLNIDSFLIEISEFSETPHKVDKHQYFEREITFNIFNKRKIYINYS